MSRRIVLFHLDRVSRLITRKYPIPAPCLPAPRL
jgi:hypothetical protein